MIISLLQNSVNNGASRWVNIMGYSLQPSELLKPFLIVIFAFLIAKENKNKNKVLYNRRESLSFFTINTYKFHFN